MKPAFLALAIVALSTVAQAENDPAYKALRQYGKKFGEPALNQVTEVRGRSGSPQPAVWKIIALDPKARGGLREVEIQRGKVIAERSASRQGASTAPLNLNDLNLDSDGAFTIVNQEMRKLRIPFDRIDYTLRSSAPRTPPIWFVDMYDGTHGKVADMEISADTGAVITQRKTGTAIAQNPPTPDYSSDRDYLRPPSANADVQPSPARVPSDNSKWSSPGEPFRGVPDFFHRLGKRMERRGDQLKRFFSGDD